MTAKQLEVQIMGQSYLLGCPEGGEDRLQAAVQKVDAAMCRIRDAGKIKARDRIAVLAALNLAFDQVDGTSSRAGPEPVAITSDGSAGERLAGLVQQLDHALGQDGRLF